MATRWPRTVTAKLMDRPQGEPGQEASSHLFKGSSGWRSQGPACLLSGLAPFPATPLHCDLGHLHTVTPSRPSFLRSPWSPLHPCLGAEYSFLSIPCPQDGAEAHPLQHCEVCLPTPVGETEAQCHRSGKEQVQAGTRHVTCLEFHA